MYWTAIHTYFRTRACSVCVQVATDVSNRATGSNDNAVGEMIDMRSIPTILARAGLDTQLPPLLVFDQQISDEVRRRNMRISRKRSINSIESGSGTGIESDSMDISQDVLASPASQTVSGDDDEKTVATLSALGGHPTIDILWPQQTGRLQCSVDAIVELPSTDPEDGLTLDSEQHQHMLQAMSKDDLIQYASRQHIMLTQHLDTVQHLRHETRMDKQRIRRLQTRLTVSKDKVFTLAHPEITELQVFRGDAKKLSWRGSVSLGLRKAMSFVSASSFPMASLLEVGRTTVIRCEILVNAYIMVRAVTFHRIMFLLLNRLATAQRQQHDPHLREEDRSDAPAYGHANPYAVVLTSVDGPGCDDVVSHDDAICKDLGLPFLHRPVSSTSPMTSSGNQSAFSIASTSFAGDATNSSIWKRQKLQGLQVTSSVMIDWSSLCKENYPRAFKTNTWMFFGNQFM